MKNILINTLVFAAGAAIGSAVTYKIVKDKYDKIIQEEIDSVKEVFSNLEKEPTYKVVVEDDIPVEDVIKEKAIDILKDCQGIIGEQNYVSYSAIKENEEKGGSDNMTNDKIDYPYVISPEEFGELDDYKEVSLTYYEDKVLTDEWDNPIENVDETVGLDSLETFGQYEDDSVFVRNDARKTDYEILMDTRNFKDLNRDE